MNTPLFAPAFRDFLIYLRITKNRSPLTVRQYAFHILSFWRSFEPAIFSDVWDEQVAVTLLVAEV